MYDVEFSSGGYPCPSLEVNTFAIGNGHSCFDQLENAAAHNSDVSRIANPVQYSVDYRYGELVSISIYPVYKLSKSKVDKRWVKCRRTILFEDED